jgi:tetratricopeptide (TPR) repeat protein
MNQAGEKKPLRYALPVVCGLLLLAVALVFGKTLRHEFVNFDDGVLVYENPMVQRGITAEGVVWALTTSGSNMWYPLTWFSFMLDRQIYGMEPWGFHLTNLLLHAAASVILFLTLRRMTGKTWASAFVAALFAVHPLQVEAVAWVGERKSPLSGLFFVSSIAAYVAYARRPSFMRYLAVAGLFALGLLAKPTIVTLPFLLLLLDYWPLGRAGNGEQGAGSRERRAGSGEQGAESGEQAAQSLAVSRSEMTRPAAHLLAVLRSGKVWLIVEKIPLLLLSIGCCVAAVLSQGENIASLEGTPPSKRIPNALISYLVYLGKFLWPTRLAAFYPYPEKFPVWQAAGALVFLAAVTWAAVRFRRTQPALLVGWLWYLGMLVPTIGLVQIGDHARADRYTYLPQIGLGMALAWMPAWRKRRLALAATMFWLPGLACLAWLQADCWRNSETLWRSALQRTSENYAAENNLGVALVDLHRPAEAIEHYRKAIAIRPDYLNADSNLRGALFNAGRIDEALRDCREHLPLTCPDAEVHFSFGVALQQRGRLEEAVVCYRRALEIKPDSVKVHNNLAAAYAQYGRLPAAIAEWDKTLQIDPGHASARLNLGKALVKVGRPAAALGVLRQGLERDPRDANLLRTTAWILATSPDAAIRSADEAVALAQRAEAIAGDDAEVLDALAAAYAESEQFDPALQAAGKALKIAERTGNRPLAAALRQRNEAYHAGKPWRDVQPAPGGGP